MMPLQLHLFLLWAINPLIGAPVQRHRQEEEGGKLFGDQEKEPVATFETKKCFFVVFPYKEPGLERNFLVNNWMIEREACTITRGDIITAKLGTWFWDNCTIKRIGQFSGARANVDNGTCSWSSNVTGTLQREPFSWSDAGQIYQNAHFQSFFFMDLLGCGSALGCKL